MVSAKQKIGKKRCYGCFSLRQLNDHLFRKELFIRFTERFLYVRLSLCVCASFLFGFESGMWDLIVLIPDHCLSIYFITRRTTSIFP